MPNMENVRKLSALGMAPQLAATIVDLIEASSGASVPATQVTVAAVDEDNFDFAGGTLQDFADAIGAAIPDPA